MPIEVLIVDEDEDVLDITGTFLDREDGLSVSTEPDPERALERVREGGFDAVVSDLRMPGLGGFELCDRIRATDRDLPFFVFTGRDPRDIEADSEAATVTGIVRKGTGTEQYERLAEQIRTAVER
ncbi:MAG: response regulator [Haloarculaceae archaeon]